MQQTGVAEPPPPSHPVLPHTGHSLATAASQFEPTSAPDARFDTTPNSLPRRFSTQVRQVLPGDAAGAAGDLRRRWPPATLATNWADSQLAPGWESDSARLGAICYGSCRMRQSAGGLTPIKRSASPTLFRLPRAAAPTVAGQAERMRQVCGFWQNREARRARRRGPDWGSSTLYFHKRRAPQTCKKHRHGSMPPRAL